MFWCWKLILLTHLWVFYFPPFWNQVHKQHMTKVSFYFFCASYNTATIQKCRPSFWVWDVERIFVQSDACVARLRLVEQFNSSGAVQWRHFNCWVANWHPVHQLICIQITQYGWRSRSTSQLVNIFVPLTSSCSLSSWFTSSCIHHLITVPLFTLIIYHPSAFYSSLKLISFTNLLDCLQGTDLGLGPDLTALGFVCFSFFLYSLLYTIVFGYICLL